MKVQRILVPVDFSEFSENALAYAIELSNLFGATLDVIHVHPLTVYAAPPLLPAPTLIGQFREDTERALRQFLDDFGQKHGVEVSGKVVDGAPHVEIVRLSEELGADLIVMGTHGRTGVRHALMGSVAERVVRMASVPVLTVPKRVQAAAE